MPIETPSNQPAEWLKQQARHVLWECDEYGVEPRFFLNDNSFCEELSDVVQRFFQRSPYIKL